MGMPLLFGLKALREKISRLVEQVKKYNGTNIPYINKLAELAKSEINKILSLETLGGDMRSLDQGLLVNIKDRVESLIDKLNVVIEKLAWEKRQHENDEAYRKRQEENLARVQESTKEDLERLEKDNIDFFKKLAEQLEAALKVLRDRLGNVDGQIKETQDKIGSLKQELERLDREIEEEINNSVQDVIDIDRECSVKDLLMKEDAEKFTKDLDELKWLQQRKSPGVDEIQILQPARELLGDLFVGLTKALEHLEEGMRVVESAVAEKEVSFSNTKHELEENRSKIEAIDKSIALGEDKGGHFQNSKNDLEDLIARQKSFAESIENEIRKDNSKLVSMKKRMLDVSKAIRQLEKTRSSLDEKSIERAKIERELREKEIRLVDLKNERDKLEENIHKHEELLSAVQSQPVEELSEKAIHKLEAEAKKQEISIQDSKSKQEPELEIKPRGSGM